MREHSVTAPNSNAFRSAGSQGAVCFNFIPAPYTSSHALNEWLQVHGFEPGHLNSRRGNQTTPLMHAAQLGRADIIHLLLAQQADLNLRNADGNNALWLACFSGDANIIRLLLEAGIDLNNRNDNGSTCLMYAASASKPAVLRQLLAAGADTHLENLDGFSALDMSASFECLQLLRPGLKHLMETRCADSALL